MHSCLQRTTHRRDRNLSSGDGYIDIETDIDLDLDSDMHRSNIHISGSPHRRHRNLVQKRQVRMDKYILI